MQIFFKILCIVTARIESSGLLYFTAFNFTIKSIFSTTAFVSSQKNESDLYSPGMSSFYNHFIPTKVIIPLRRNGLLCVKENEKVPETQSQTRDKPLHLFIKLGEV